MRDYRGVKDFDPQVKTSVLADAVRQYNRAQHIFRCYTAGVFNAVPREYASVDVFAHKAGFLPRRLEIVLDMLESFDLVEKQCGEYRLSDEAAKFLHASSPYFLGDYLTMELGAEQKNGEALRRWLRGEPALNEHKPEQIYSNSFVHAMAQDAFLQNSIHETVRLIGDHESFRGGKKLLDVGGGHGLFAIALKKRHPDLEIGVFDLPQNEAVALEYAENCGEEMAFYPGNFYINDLPGEQNIVLCCDIMYPMSGEKRNAVYQKVYDALVQGGQFFLKLWYLDEDRTGPQRITTLATKLRMLSDESYVYTLEETCSALTDLGFAVQEVLSPCENSWKIISAIKK